MLQYREATDRRIAGLQRQTKGTEEDVSLLRTGMSMADKMRRSQSSELSRDLTRQLEAFEAVRREMRVSVTAALLDEGLSTEAIGELFGVTRQLAGRFVREARRNVEPTAPTPPTGPSGTPV